MKSAVWLDNACHGEDRIVRRRNLFAIMDGATSENGAIASEAVKAALETCPMTPMAVKAALETVHERLVAEQEPPAMTTVVVLLPKHRLILNAGDSPAYHVDKTITLVSTIDSPRTEPNLLTQAIGSGDMTIHEHRYEPGRFLLLMSDGISDNMSPAEIFDACDAATPAAVLGRIKRTIARLKKESKSHIYDGFKDDDRAVIVLG